MSVLSNMSTTKKVVLGSLLVLGLVGGTATAMMSGHHGGITNHLSNKLNMQPASSNQTSHLKLEDATTKQQEIASHRATELENTDMKMPVSHQLDQRQMLAILAKAQMNSSPMLIKTAAFTGDSSPATMLLKVNGGNHGQDGKGHDNGKEQNGHDDSQKKHGKGHENDNDKTHGNKHDDTSV